MKKETYVAIGVVLAIVLGIFLGFNPFQTMSNDQVAPGEGEVKDLSVETTADGQGEGAKAGDEIAVNYTGMLTNGEVFDSSLGRGEPLKFILGTGRVIPGWDQGLMGAKVGEKRKLVIPPSLAYGERGVSDGQGGYIIPPQATLIFEVEVVGIVAK